MLDKTLCECAAIANKGRPSEDRLSRMMIDRHARNLGKSLKFTDGQAYGVDDHKHASTANKHRNSRPPTLRPVKPNTSTKRLKHWRLAVDPIARLYPSNKGEDLR